MGEYHDLYLRCDALQLAAVFEHFRDACFTYYGLDPAYYMTLPSFAWDPMLNMFELWWFSIWPRHVWDDRNGDRGGVC